MVKIENLKNNKLFKEISDSDLKELLPFCEEKTFNAGQDICSYGEKGEEFFLLLDGDVRLQIPTDQKFGITVIFIEVGNAFGFSGLLEPYSYSSTARCVENTKVIAIENGPFLNFLSNRNLRIGFILMKNLASILMNRLNTNRQNLSNLVSQVQISIP